VFGATGEHRRDVAAYQHSGKFARRGDIAERVGLCLRGAYASEFKDGKDERKVLTTMELAEHTATTTAGALTMTDLYTARFCVRNERGI